LKLPGCVIVVDGSPLLDPLRFAFHPLGHAGHYNIGQATAAAEMSAACRPRAGIGSHQAHLLALVANARRLLRETPLLRG
jgi:hypothetical protein